MNIENICEHKWIFQYIGYKYETESLPGSGAYARIYIDKYFCEKCASILLRNEREIGNSYQKPLDNTFPL